MVDQVLGIRGRLEVGETLTAYGLGSGTVSTVQWQAWNGNTWENVGTAGSLTYTVMPHQVGWQFRLSATSGPETYRSLATAAITLDTKKETAPTLADPGLQIIFGPTEHVTYTGFFTGATFGDADKGRYTGATLLVQNTNSLAHGGDGGDVLSVELGSGNAGSFSYDAASRTLFYHFEQGSPVAIGQLDAGLNGQGNDLRIAFNGNATTAAINALVGRVQLANDDDSPEHYRMLTVTVTDPTGRAAQYAMPIEITGLPDAPIFTGSAHFTMAENQSAAGTVSAIDPDREAGAPQGMTYSLVAGEGGTDNAAFRIDGATGALAFTTPVNYEAFGHAPSYSVRVRATDAEGSTAEQVVTVDVTNVNEAPAFWGPAFAYTYEDGASVDFFVGAYDFDANDTLTLTYDASQLVGSLSLSGNKFTYDPGANFDYLSAFASASEFFTVTVTDASGLSATRSAEVVVFGANDPATISGTLAATVREDATPWTTTITGTVSVSDPDQGEGFLYGISGSGMPHIGTLLAAGQNWTYYVDNSSLQFLGAGETFDDVFVLRSFDGTAQAPLTITLVGVNDAPIIVGAIGSGAALEAGSQADGTLLPGMPVVRGAVMARDADTSDVLSWSGSANGVYGQFAIDGATGQWTYTLDNNRAETDALRQGDTVTERFTARVTDSTGAFAQYQVSVAVVGTEDSAGANGPLAG